MAAEPDVTAPARAGRLARDALLIAAVTAAARLVGFGRVVVFARTVGPTCVGDVYTTANTIPNIVFDVVAGGALSGLVVPVLAGRFDAGDLAGARRVLGALFAWTAVLLVPLAVAGALLATPLMSVLVGGGHSGCARGSEVALGAQMLRVFAPQVVLYGVGIVSAGAMQARRRFAGPAVAPLLSSLVVIASYLAYKSIGASSALSTHLYLDTAVLAGGTTLGVVLLSLPLLAPAASGLRLRPTLRFPPGVGRDVARLAAAGAVVLGSQQLATAVVIRLANSYGSPGAVVAWNLGWTVFLVPWAVVAVPIATSAFPRLTVAWSRGDRSQYAETVTETTRGLLLATGGAAALLVAAAQPAARILVAGAPGGFPPAELARVLTAFAPGVVGFGLLAHLSRARFARGDARGPAVATAAGWAVAVAADVLAAPRIPAGWVPAALAGATSLGVSVAAGFLAVRPLRADGGDVRALVRTAVVAVGGWSVGAAAGRIACAGLLSGGPAAAVGVAAAGAAVTLIGGGTVVLLGDREAALWLRCRWRRA